jgi:F420-dependent oxidoreductase-like protein
MRIGLFAGATPGAAKRLKGIVDYAQAMEVRGFDSIWMANIFGTDAIAACALAGWETKRIELGTAVTPVYPRHPGAIAQQAMTTQDACDGRFTLGIGLSHQMVIEGMFGMSYAKPASYMKEYLEILCPLLRGEAADFEGQQLTGKMALDMDDVPHLDTVVAALGTNMLKLAGTYTAGTSTWMTGPRTIEEHILPTISAAAAQAGREAPRIICGMPVCLTSDVAAAREYIAKILQIYGMLPSYRAMLDKEGVAGPEELAIVGDEVEIRAGMARLRDAGVTDFNAAVIAPPGGEVDGLLDLLQGELH